MNPPVDANGYPVTIGDLTSRPLPPAPPAAAAVFAAPAPGAVNQELREDILRIFGLGGENILQHLTAANYMIYVKRGMFLRYQRDCDGRGVLPVSKADFIANLYDLIKMSDNKGGRKNKRKSMKGKSMKRKSMKGKSMKQKSMKRKSMKRMNKRKNKMHF